METQLIQAIIANTISATNISKILYKHSDSEFLTGELNEISKFAKNWNIYWEKVSEEDSYTINHTATVFMINEKGNFSGTIAWGESDKSIKLKLKKLLNL